MNDMQPPGDEDTKTPPPRSRAPGPLVVGVGASAGGLEALGHLLENTPADTGLAFVIVTHAQANRPNLLRELLARHSAMPIVPVTAATRVEPDHVYLAPAGEQLVIQGGVLHAGTPPEGALRHSIDVFFRSLAADVKERAVGIVLSGTGSDGTLGIKEIKAQSGMTMAQAEASARFAAMPHSAIASLQVDYVLSPEEMPRALVNYAASATRRQNEPNDQAANLADQFARIFALLRARTGHDFSHYKGSTIRRRIERRMNVQQLESLDDYLHFLQDDAGEIDRLFKELLIGVTSFFRDPGAHEALTNIVLPQLLKDKPDGYTLRAWVAGCSTGEEAYSLAIELREAMEQAKLHFGVQIFATDLDAEAIEVARLGAYPESIATDVSPRRLERFFTRVEEGYFRINKDIREMLVFAPHSLIEDPPFTKLDLLSCRNLLIYLEARLQQQLMPVFHHSLRPGGVLFLGSSESVGGFGHLFEPLDKKWKIFRRKDVASGPHYLSDVTLMPTAPPARELGAGAMTPRSLELGLAQSAERALLHHLVPPAIIMHERGEIVHIHGRTGQFLEPPPGPQGPANVYNMVREGLQLDLAVAVRHAAAAEGAIIHRGVRVKTDGHQVTVDLKVKKLNQPEHLKGLYLVAFERAELVADGEPRGSRGLPAEEIGGRLTELERELAHSKEVHQSTIEELETSNEELKSTNEELQSTNEELQSANEELETSKEEMQSLNEELQTVNAELQGKVEELSRANDDMKNLLNGTDIATIFLDNELNIKRYTEQARKVIRLIPSDVGRPVGDLVSTLKYRTLSEDAQEVLRNLVFKEAEVQSEDGAWYLMRILPYRTMENVIDGLVVTFVDISKVKGLQEDVRRFVAALAGSPTSMFGQDGALTYEWAFGSILGHPGDQLVGRRDDEVFGEDAPQLVELKREVLAKGKPVRRRLQLGANGSRREHDLYIQPALGGAGRVLGVVGVMMAADGDKAGL